MEDKRASNTRYSPVCSSPTHDFHPAQITRNRSSIAARLRRLEKRGRRSLVIITALTKIKIGVVYSLCPPCCDYLPRALIRDSHGRGANHHPGDASPASSLFLPCLLPRSITRPFFSSSPGRAWSGQQRVVVEISPRPLSRA